MGLLITMDIFTSARTWWSPRTLQQTAGPPRLVADRNARERYDGGTSRVYKTCAAFPVRPTRIAENFNVYRAAAAAAGRVVGPRRPSASGE